MSGLTKQKNNLRYEEILKDSTYNPDQINGRIYGGVYKGGLIKNIELDTGLQKLLELEEKVYMRQLTGGGLLRKADTEVTTGYSNWYQVLYGRKAWTCINYEANVFALLPKEPWKRSGWRIETAEAGVARSGGVKEKGQFPDTVAPEWREVSAGPKTIVHGFDLSEIAEFLQSKDDALDILPELRDSLAKAHRHHINEQLCCNVTTLPSTFPQAGVGVQSIDRVCSSFAEVSTCGDVQANDSDIYGIDRDAAASTCFDAIVGENNNVDRDLTLALIDNVMQQIWANGADPKVIITGWDTLMHWSELLQAQQRFLEVSRIVPTFGGVRGAPHPGIEGGFLVASYMGKPIIPTQDCVVDTISRIYFLDTDYIKFAVAKPTRYFETGFDESMIYINLLGMEGWYETIGELRAYRLNAHGKLRDLR